MDTFTLCLRYVSVVESIVYQGIPKVGHVEVTPNDRQNVYLRI